MPGKINGIAAGSIFAGSVFVWSGIKGWSVLGTIGDIVSGKKPHGTETAVLTAADNSGSSGLVTPGPNPGGLAGDALKYKGHAYQYGGAPGTSGNNPWDCSSFVNWVVGHDMQQSIPGYGPGKYDGSSHGPPTMSWGVWPGLTHLSTIQQLQAGDIIVWTGHMGIALGPDQMISALNSQLGTVVTPIQGYGNGPLMCYGRL